jgi:hypothetical protein
MSDDKSSQSSSRGRRLRKSFVAILAAALTAAIATLIVNITTSAVQTVPKTIHRLIEGTQSGRTIHVVLNTATGPTIALSVAQGMGCPPNQGWVFPYAPQKIGDVPPGTGPRRGGRTWDKDPAAFGAIPADPITLIIYATGGLNHAVILTGLRFHVVSRRPAIQGTLLNTLGGCGGGGTFRYGRINLDLPPPYWVPNARLPVKIRADALRFPYTITAKNPEALYIEVTTNMCACSWDATLDWVDGNVVGHTKITDHGHPFAITAHNGIPASIWFGSKRIQFLPKGEPGPLH